MNALIPSYVDFQELILFYNIVIIMAGFAKYYISRSVLSLKVSMAGYF